MWRGKYIGEFEYLLALSSGGVAKSFASSSKLAFLLGVLDSGRLAKSVAATRLLDADFVGSCGTLSANFSTLNEFASIGAANSTVALFARINDSVTAKRSRGT